MAEWQGYGIGLEKQYYVLRNAEEADLYEKEFIWTGTGSIFCDSRCSICEKNINTFGI